MSNKLYVGNLSFNTTDEDLKNAFAQIGNVESVNVIIDRETGRARGFGFVEMATAEEATQCIEALDSKEFMGRNLRVNLAETKKKPAYRNTY